MTPTRSIPSPALLSALSDGHDNEDWFELHQLAEELSVIEHRLGTEFEKEQDQRLAREIGHDIRNKLNLLQMRADFRVMLLSKDSLFQQTG